MRTIGKLLKIPLLLFAVFILVFSVYLTKISTEDRGTVKEVAYDITKSKTHYLLDSVESDVTKQSGTSSEELTYKTSIVNVYTESLNTQVNEIIKGQDYYLYFTVVFTPENHDYELSGDKSKAPNALGTVNSADWQYFLQIPEGKNEADYGGVIPRGQTVMLEYFVKTNEPIEDLGFYLGKKIDKEMYKNYIKFIPNYESDEYKKLEKKMAELDDAEEMKNRQKVLDAKKKKKEEILNDLESKNE